MADRIFLGVDIGGTKTRVAAVTDDNVVIAMGEEATGDIGGADPGLSRSLALARRLAGEAEAEGRTITAVGVGVPEYVDPDGVLRSRLVVAWDRQPADLFAEIAPVAVESDVRCGAIAEAEAGAGVGVASMLYVTVGTGISSALVIDGRVWPGHRGEAIALGELPIDGSLDPGAATTVEDFASGAAVALRYHHLTGEHVNGAREVIARSSRHDALAQVIIDTSARAVGAAIAGAVGILDPEVVVIGGGFGTSGGQWEAVVREAYGSRVRPDAARLVLAHLGTNSPVIGAAIAARRTMA